jgi:hypothetical protein
MPATMFGGHRLALGVVGHDRVVEGLPREGDLVLGGGELLESCIMF